MTEIDIMACELALAEACNNAIQYAPPEGKQSPVVVNVSITTSTIELKVIDHTAGFEWPELVELPDQEQEGGRGIFLIHSLMDQVSYRRGTGENALSLSKQLSQPNGLAAAGLSH